MGERWRYTCEDHRAAVQEELLGGGVGSGFTSTCGRPDCDARWVGTIGQPSASPQAAEKPNVVICANRHKFAVLEMRATPEVQLHTGSVRRLAGHRPIDSAASVGLQHRAGPLHLTDEPAVLLYSGLSRVNR